MSPVESPSASVFILYRQPDYDAIFSALDNDGPVPDEGEEWQLGVYSTREAAESELAAQELRRAQESVIFVIDEYRLGELHWLSGFFVDEGD